MYKRMHLGLVVALASSAAAYAQEVHFGVQGGLSRATVVGGVIEGEGIDREHRIDPTGGAFVEIGGERLAFRAEVLYAVKGVRFTAPETDDQLQARISYLEVPVLLEGRLAAGSVRPYVAAGAAGAFRLSARTQLVSGGRTVEEEDVEHQTKGFDLGLVLAGGVEAPVGRGRVSLEARYTGGLLRVNTDSVDPDKVKNRVLSLLVGLSF